MGCNEDHTNERRTGAFDVRRIRRRLKYTQRQFAGYFGLSLATLRHWECGNRRPAGSALVLLQVIADNPRIVLQAVRKLRTGTPSVMDRVKPPRSFRAPPGMVATYWRGD
jgi:DNA-binding XRE family transcriptional regulator